MNVNDAARNLARSQHGVLTRRQLVEMGVSRHAVARAIESGRLDALSPRVLRLAGAPNTVRQRLMAATLDVPGSAVAFQSAAAMWKVPGFDLEPAHVLTTRRPHRDRERVGPMHSSTRLVDGDTTVQDGIPVTTPLRTLQDLAGRIHEDRLGAVCDRMLATRLIRLDALHALAATLPARGGRSGTRAVRRLALRRPEGFRPAESNLERRFERVIDRAGDEPFERQVDLGDDDGWIGRVDFLDRALRVVVEVQSALYHGGLLDQERDARRIGRLRRAGWSVVEVTDDEVWNHPERVVARVRAARAAARHRKVAHQGAVFAPWRAS